MIYSKEQLFKDAKEQGFKIELLEKVYKLLDVLRQFVSVPYLKDRLVLKGGTALNLFCLDKLPRLSVDIDLNYIGELEREKMLEDKAIIVEAIHQILLQNKFEPHRSPMHHAGGKMVWFYNSVLGQRGALEIDLNFMYRQPLFPIAMLSPNITKYTDLQIPVLDIHEVAAGKLTALFDRSVSRDVFDSHYLLTKANLDNNLLRQAFVVYIAMTKINLDSLVPGMISYDLTDLKNRLLPVLHQPSLEREMPRLKCWAEKMVSELQEALSIVLPLGNKEIEFIKRIRGNQHIAPELITSDPVVAKRILSQPALKWVMSQSNR